MKMCSEKLGLSWFFQQFQNTFETISKTKKKGFILFVYVFCLCNTFHPFSFLLLLQQGVNHVGHRRWHHLRWISPCRRRRILCLHHLALFGGRIKCLTSVVGFIIKGGSTWCSVGAEDHSLTIAGEEEPNCSCEALNIVALYSMCAIFWAKRWVILLRHSSMRSTTMVVAQF